MKLTISFKHLEHTPALDEKIREKSDRLSKFFDDNFTVDWVCWVEDNHHWAEMKVHGRKSNFFAKGSADTMYKVLDVVVEKMERQLEKHKQMITEKIHNDHSELPKYSST
jgi:putative sigma-54 modulation protein